MVKTGIEFRLALFKWVYHKEDKGWIYSEGEETYLKFPLLFHRLLAQVMW